MGVKTKDTSFIFNLKTMAKATKNNQFAYETGNNTVTKGWFNLYQGKNGAIYIQMGSTITKLTESQLHDLGTDVYSLKDFDQDEYLRHYKNEAAGLPLNIRK